MTDPEQPTRPVRPVGGPRQPHAREAVVADDAAWRELLLDRIRSLRNALMLVGVLAVAALGVAVYALITANDAKDDDTAGRSRPAAASAARVRALDDRVDRLRDQLDAKASKTAVSELRADVEKLQQQASDDSASQDVDQLKQDVDELKQQVDDLEQQQQESGTTP